VTYFLFEDVSHLQHNNSSLLFIFKLRETKSQVRWSTNVWCGILNNTLIGPYFYKGTLTGEHYFNFLENILPLLLENVPLHTRECMWVQQDGAPPHNANIVKNYLNNTFHCDG